MAHHDAGEQIGDDDEVQISVPAGYALVRDPVTGRYKMTLLIDLPNGQ